MVLFSTRQRKQIDTIDTSNSPETNTSSRPKVWSGPILISPYHQKYKFVPASSRASLEPNRFKNDLRSCFQFQQEDCPWPDLDVQHICENFYLGSQPSVLEFCRRMEVSCCLNVSREISEEQVFCEELLTLCPQLIIWPLEDSFLQDIDLDTLDEIVNVCIDMTVRNHQPILVFCQAGISRSAMICLAYMMKYFNISYNTAYDLVIKKRNIINPNSAFRGVLKKYNLYLQTPKK